MRWNIEKSEDLKLKIAANEPLTRKLGETVAQVMDEFEVDMEGMCYVFEPRIFSYEPKDLTEIRLKGRDSFLEDLARYLKHKVRITEDIFDYVYIPKRCLPECGIVDPSSLETLERLRIGNDDDLDLEGVPWQEAPLALMRRIVGSKKLLLELSRRIFSVLREHRIVFEENEGCVFTPMVVEAPVYAQMVAKKESVDSYCSFGPQILGAPDLDIDGVMPIPLPGIIPLDFGDVPGIIFHKWWWIGIPAPELLRALDVMREFH